MTDAEALELKFLRHFYDVAGDCMGPADDEIYHMIRQEFKDKHGVLPEGYGDEDEDCE